VARDVLAVPTGVGPGNFNVEGDPANDHHSAHSEYLGMLAERGFVGLVGWCGLLAGVFAMVTRLRSAAAAGFRPLGVEPLYGLVAAIVLHALVVELSHFRHVWMVLAVISAAAAQTAVRATADGPEVLPVLAEAA